MELYTRRDVSTLFGDTLRLFGAHAGLFTTVTLLVVAPVTILVDGVWAEGFAEGPAGTPPVSAAIGSAVINTMLVPPLVTALHVTLVQRIAAGQTPGVGDAVRAAGTRLGAVLGAFALYILAVVAGLVLLIIPGIWIATRLYFAVQAAVVESRRPVDALRRSSEIVRGRWWPTFGRVLLATIVFGLFAVPLGIVMALFDDGVVFILLTIAANTLILSLTALFATLLFFELAHGR